MQQVHVTKILAGPKGILTTVFGIAMSGALKLETNCNTCTRTVTDLKRIRTPQK